MSVERIEVLVNEVRSISDAAARDAALELVQAVMELHRESIGRMMEIVKSADGGGAVVEAFTCDAAVSGILLLHDLHPLELETRVRRALAEKTLRARGARADVIAIRDGVVQVRIEGDAEFEAAVRRAITEAAPDAAEIVIESPRAGDSQSFVRVEQLLAGSTT